MTPFLQIASQIREKNRKREEFLSPFARKTGEALREKQFHTRDEDFDMRPAFAHDVDRIIHCHAYSRYMDKTQVFFQVQNDHITKRASHVQMVSRIARTIGRALSLNEDLIEAVALGHDLGHTPFGHAGEDALSRIMNDCGQGNFLHNAQSVRLLRCLEHHGLGLNITLETLDGIIGHNGELPVKELIPARENLTWEKLNENQEKCFSEPRTAKIDKTIQPSTLEGCVVRFSDIISYLGRDIEDALLLHLITREELPSSATDICGYTNRSIIDFFCKDIVENSFEQDCIAMSGDSIHAMRTLMDFNYRRIYKSAALEEQKEKFFNMVSMLFEAYLDDLKKGNESSEIFKLYLSGFDNPDGYLNGNTPERIICDYISQMTDDYFMSRFSRRFLIRKLEYQTR